jgi:hypothetical protein
MGEPSAPASQDHNVKATGQSIPTQYNDATKLTATIVAGKTNDLKFDLQIPAGRKAK